MAETQKTVLVVDDEAEMRSLLGSLLTRHGMIVDYASNGDEAVALISATNYAVVLLDLLMPGTDGFAVLDKLQEGGAAAPVVLVVTAADRTVTDKLDAQRIHGIVRKPFDPQELASLIVACSEIKRRGSFGSLAIATLVSVAPFLALLVHS